MYEITESFCFPAMDFMCEPFLLWRERLTEKSSSIITDNGLYRNHLKNRKFGKEPP